MTDEDRFPYERSTWKHHDEKKQRQWYEVLERTGPENVRARLAQVDAGSAGSISIGTEHTITIGFVQEWLAWHDRRKAERERAFRENQIFWTRWAALAATTVAAAGVIGWVFTIWRKW
jgi:hypothetical protein